MNAWIELIGRCLHDAALTSLLFDAWFKSLAVLAVAGGVCFVLRRAAAATRHWIWFLALASLPCLLLLSAVPHAWQRPLWSVSTGFTSGNQFSLALDLAPAPAVPPAETARASPAEVRAGSRQPLAAHFSASLLVLGIVIWLLGIMVGLLSVLAGQVQLHRLARNALPLDSSDWTLLLREACDKLRLRRPVRLLQSADNPMPLTWGWWRPVVLLPADAAHWPAERRRVVLLHELAHAKRWDCLTQTVARMVCALYWINPLVWLAARQMCVERERACDDLVLSSGCRASDYATHLVDVARTFRRAPQLAGIAMARSSQLQGRIAAIVDASQARGLRPLTALAILGLMGALALSVGGSSSDTSRKQAEDNPLRQQQNARLQPLATAKVAEPQLLSNLSDTSSVGVGPYPDVSVSPPAALFDDFKRRVEAAMESDDLATIQALYQTNGVTADELNLEFSRWQGMLGPRASFRVSWFYKQLETLPPKARVVWTEQARCLTKRDVTYLAFVRYDSLLRLTLPLVVMDGKLMIVVSERLYERSGRQAAPVKDHARAEQPIRLDQLGPSLGQLGQGWTSNSVVVMVDPSNPTKEYSNEGAGWLRVAHNVVGKNGCEAQTVFRYWYGQSSILVWIVRCRSKEDIGDHWGRDYDAKTEASLDSLPKVGDEVRFYRRGGMHDNIAFRRANYLVDVEGVSVPMEQLKQLAAVLDSNLANAQKGHVVEGTNQGKQMHTGTLTGAQAEALAMQLANEKAKALYNCQPFRKGTPAQFVQGHWVWHDLRGQGSSDVEATVKFEADGTNPEVDVILLDSRPSLRLPPP